MNPEGPPEVQLRQLRFSRITDKTNEAANGCARRSELAAWPMGPLIDEYLQLCDIGNPAPPGNAEGPNKA